MRLTPLWSCLLLLALCGPGASHLLGQDDDTIHVVTTLMDDGSKTVTRFDPSKHSSDASTFDAHDRLRQRVVYQLDESNQPSSGIVYTPDNRAAFKTTYKRNAANQMEEEDDYTMDDQLIRRFVYEYEGAKLRRIRAFDAQGNEMQQAGAGEAKKDVPQHAPRRRR